VAWFALDPGPAPAVVAEPGSGAATVTAASGAADVVAREPARESDDRAPAESPIEEATGRPAVSRLDSGAPTWDFSSFRLETELVPESIVVTGTVRGSISLEGLKVTFTGGRPARFHPAKPEAVATDASGRYEIELTSSGAYDVRLEGAGLATLRRSIRIPDEGTVVDFVVPSSRIAGRVFGPDGRAVKYVRVQLSPDDPAGGSSAQTFDSCWTDDAGHFAFGGVESGTYRLATDVMSMAGSRFFRNAVPVVALRGIEVGGDQRVDELAIHITAGATILVQVLSPDGSPASGATVDWVQDLGVVGESVANSVGLARLEGLAPGETRLFARAPSGAVRIGQTFDLTARAVFETTIRLQPGTVLDVRLESAKREPFGNLRGNSVVVRDVTDRGRRAFKSPWGRSESGRFGPLPEGDYEVHVTFGSGKEVRQTVYVSGSAEQQLVVREPD
jgi:hypothetical protein